MDGRRRRGGSDKGSFEGRERESVLSFAADMSPLPAKFVAESTPFLDSSTRRLTTSTSIDRSLDTPVFVSPNRSQEVRSVTRSLVKTRAGKRLRGERLVSTASLDPPARIVDDEGPESVTAANELSRMLDVNRFPVLGRRRRSVRGLVSNEVEDEDGDEFGEENQSDSDGSGVEALPLSVIRAWATKSTSLSLDKDSLELLQKCSSRFLDQLVDDLGSFARHAGRRTIERADFELLTARIRFLNAPKSKINLNDLIYENLSRDFVESAIPVASPGNVVVPGGRKRKSTEPARKNKFYRSGKR